MNLEKLLILLGAWRQAEIDGLARESDQSAGSTYLRERLTVIAERCCRDYPGDIVEIGCLNGSTTVLFCQVAKEHGRRVIAVDPYLTGSQNCSGDELPRFLKAIEPYRDMVDFLRMDSRSQIVREYLKKQELAFSFIDGLHEHDACLLDIQSCYHSALLAVDDWQWNKGIECAITEATGKRNCIMMQPYHEAYLL